MESEGISRRSVVTAGVWAVPVVAVAVATPAAAASVPGVPLLYWDRATVGDRGRARLFVELPDDLSGSVQLGVAPTGRIADWTIRPIESAWPPDGSYAYPYLAWRTTDPRAGTYSFLIEFTRFAPDATDAEFISGIYSSGTSTKGTTISVG